MKKLLIVLMSTMFCLTIFAGCNKNNEDNNINNGGTNVNNEQTEIETISTLEGIWESEEDKNGFYERLVVEGNSIKFYYRLGPNMPENGTLWWAGIYSPINGPVSDGSWTFPNDDECLETRPDTHDRTFKYSNGELSCDMINSFGDFTTIYLTKVAE